MAYMTTENEERSELEAQAREWLVRLTSGRATTFDAQAFRQWCGKSRAHAEAMAETTRVWDLAKKAGAALTVDARGPVSRPARVPSPGRRAFFGSAVAAGAAAYLVVRPPARLWPALSDMTADYHTGTGEQRDLKLDGVVIRMNTQTAVNLGQDADGKRSASDVELLSGETQVVLDRSPARPVTVRAGDGSLLMASTASFNVRATGGDVCVTCLQGQGDISAAGQTRTLTAGQQAKYGGRRLSVSSNVDLIAVESWRDRVLTFDNISLAAAVDEINRYRPGRLIITTAALGRRRVQARLRVDQLSEIVSIIQDTYGAKATVLPAGIVLLS